MPTKRSPRPCPPPCTSRTELPTQIWASPRNHPKLLRGFAPARTVCPSHRTWYRQPCKYDYRAVTLRKRNGSCIFCRFRQRRRGRPTEADSVVDFVAFSCFFTGTFFPALPTPRPLSTPTILRPQGHLLLARDHALSKTNRPLLLENLIPSPSIWDMVLS